jgi:NAD-dependent SIR2 family protein deacetylase
MYGTQLPNKFFQACDDDFPSPTDLMIVAGTSLTVGPANQLVCKVCPIRFSFFVHMIIGFGEHSSPHCEHGTCGSGPWN